MQKEEGATWAGQCPASRVIKICRSVWHAVGMRIFISSVRRGLEVERDALPGLIRAIGHEPTRFEDFGARAEPSREACIAGVDASDAYLLLLGPHYGHRFDETGQSPTHDEWVAATTRGLWRMVFRKSAVDFDVEQEAFAREVGDYSSGVFYAEFADTADLLTKVAETIGRLANTPATLTYEPLKTAPPFAWHDDWDSQSPSRFGIRDRAFLELHVIALDAPTRPAREMRDMPTRLVVGLRAAGLLAVHAGADISGSTAGAAFVTLPLDEDRPDAINSVVAAQPMGVRLAGRGNCPCGGQCRAIRWGRSSTRRTSAPISLSRCALSDCSTSLRATDLPQRSASADHCPCSREGGSRSKVGRARADSEQIANRFESYRTRPSRQGCSIVARLKSAQR